MENKVVLGTTVFLKILLALLVLNCIKDNMSEIIKLTLGHIVANYEEMKGYCGENGYGWEYGTAEDATCLECREVFSGLK